MFIFGPGHAKMCLMPYANNKGADQPAHSRSLISTFNVRCLDSMICIFARATEILKSKSVRSTDDVNNVIHNEHAFANPK